MLPILGSICGHVGEGDTTSLIAYEGYGGYKNRIWWEDMLASIVLGLRVYGTKLVVICTFPLRIIDWLSLVNINYNDVITWLVNH